MKYKTHRTKAKGRRKPIFQETKLLLEDEKCKRPFSALGLITCSDSTCIRVNDKSASASVIVIVQCLTHEVKSSCQVES